LKVVGSQVYLFVKTANLNVPTSCSYGVCRLRI